MNKIIVDTQSENSSVARVGGKSVVVKVSKGNTVVTEESATATVAEESAGEPVTEEAAGDATDETAAEDTAANEVAAEVPKGAAAGDGMNIDPGFEEGMYVDPTMETGMAEVKDPLLSSWPFVIGISAAVLFVSITLGALLARRKIKKGIDLYED